MDEIYSSYIFRWGSVDHLISKCSKPPKDNKKEQKTVFFNERCNRAFQKEFDNGDNDKDKKIYEFMARMSGNNESSVRNFGDSSKLINCILDLGLTCHMKPQVSYFIPCLLEDADKYIEVVDGHHFIAKQKVKVQINCAAITEILSSQHCTT